MSSAQLWHRIQQGEKSRLEARAIQPGHSGYIRLTLKWNERGDNLIFSDHRLADVKRYEAHAPGVPSEEVEQDAKEDIERQYHLVPWIPRKYCIGQDIKESTGGQHFAITAAAGAEALAMFNEGDPSVEFVDEEVDVQRASDPYFVGIE